MKAFNLAMTHLGFFFLGAATAISWWQP